MEYIAFIKFDEKAKNALPGKSLTQICPMKGISESALGARWLLNNYGSIAEEIIMSDSFGEMTVVK